MRHHRKYLVCIEGLTLAQDNDKRMLLYNDWYMTAIEEPIRELVKRLRDRGINTTCSCGHDMTIEGDVNDIQHEEWVISTTLIELGFKDFKINYERTIGPSVNYFRFHIEIKKQTMGMSKKEDCPECKGLGYIKAEKKGDDDQFCRTCDPQGKKVKFKLGEL